MASSRDPWQPPPPDYTTIDNGAGAPGSATANNGQDIAYIINKLNQGLALTPQEQAQWNAHVAEGNARANGGGGAANGPVGSGFYAPGGFASTATNLAVPNGGPPKDPLGTPLIPDGQSFSGTGLGNLASTSGVKGLGGLGNPNPTGAVNPKSVPQPFVMDPKTGQMVPNPGASNAGGVGTGGAVDPNVQALLDYARQNQQQNVGFVDNQVTPALAASQAANAGVIDNQRGQDSWLAGQYMDMLGRQQSDAGAANNMSGQALAGYGGLLSGINSSNTGYVNNLASTYAGMSQLTPTQQRANQVAVQAGLTTASYQTAQLYQAALERAQANPNDVQAQKDLLALSTKIAQGGSDVQNGGLTPEAKQAQLSALSQYGALTSPEVTAKERFLYEEQRQKQEQEEKASRDALMQDYRLRGMGGSGAELANVLQSGQQNSQERLLGDLGTQAGAVDRSMQALAGYSGLSTQMMAQGNQVDQYNKSQRLQALGLSADQANNIAGQSQQLSEYNAGQANNVNMFNSGQANQNAQFNANAYNSNQQFNAGQANNVGMFNAGQVNAVGMNNTNQNMIQGRFEDQYRADQQTGAANRAATLASTGLTSNANNATNLSNYNTAYQTGINNAYGRNLDTTNLQGQGATNIANAGRATNSAAIQGNNQTQGNILAVGGQRLAANSPNATIGAMNTGIGDAAAKAALGLASQPADNSFWSMLGIHTS